MGSEMCIRDRTWRGDRCAAHRGLDRTILSCLVHATHKAVDVALAVTSVTTLDEVVELALPVAASRAGQLEGPEELVHLLEVGAGSGNLVHNVLDRDDAVLAQVLLDDVVVRDGDALAVDLGVAALVQQLADALEVRLAVGHVRLNVLEHLLRRVVELHEHTVVDLQQTEQLHDLARLGRDVADTAQTHNERHLGLGRHKHVTLRLGHAAQTDLLALLRLVFLQVLLSALEDDLALLLPSLYGVSALQSSRHALRVPGAPYTLGRTARAASRPSAPKDGIFIGSIDQPQPKDGVLSGGIDQGLAK